MASISHALTPGQYKLNYDAVKSFAPITLVAKSPLFVLVRPSHQESNSLKDLIALAKTKPGQLNYGTSGPYSSSGLAAILLQKDTGIKMTPIGYKGGDTVMTAIWAVKSILPSFHIVGATRPGQGGQTEGAGRDLEGEEFSADAQPSLSRRCRRRTGLRK